MKQPMSREASKVAVPIPIEAVRMVYPITNPETGVTKDTIIRHLKATPPDMRSDHMTHDRWEYGNKWDRVVPGMNISIPWPETQPPQFETHAADTGRVNVEDRTFYYNLLTPPMPSPVLDELRNKYSRFRTRHEPEYMARKAAQEDMKKGRHQLLVQMQMPGEQFSAKQKELKAAQGEPELSDEMLEKLGQIIAQTKAASLEDAGATDVTPKAQPTKSS
jgi:large subunit ribosomal protein L24